MTDSNKSKTFLGASKDYFGMKPGQDYKGFAAEVKGLTPQDKLDLAHGLSAEGFTITDLDKLTGVEAK
jgi:hypothetical protein